MILYTKLPTDQDITTQTSFKNLFSEELKKINKGRVYDFSDGLVLLKKYLETVSSQILQEKFQNPILWVPVAESMYSSNEIYVFVPHLLHAVFPFYHKDQVPPNRL